MNARASSRRWLILVHGAGWLALSLALAVACGETEAERPMLDVVDDDTTADDDTSTSGDTDTTTSPDVAADTGAEDDEMDDVSVDLSNEDTTTPGDTTTGDTATGDTATDDTMATDTSAGDTASMDTVETCVPTLSCGDPGAVCGQVADDGCGNPLECGGCQGTQTCEGNACVGCNYQTVFEQSGDVLTVVDGASQWSVEPLQPGEGFFCMKVEFDLQTVDNLAATDAAYEGCPLFTALAFINGQQTDVQLLSAWWRFLRVNGCAPRSDVPLVVDTWLGSNQANHNWSAGDLYHVELEIKPFTASVTVHKDGQVFGPVVSVDITGATVDDVRDPIVLLGLDKIYTNAYFPWFAATYSNLVIQADVAPAP